MKKVCRNPKQVHQPFSNYSHCVEVIKPDKLLFCAGQIPATKDGEILSVSDFDAQAELVIENLKSVLSSSGAQLTDIVRLVTYLTRKQDVPLLRGLLKRYFPINPPANSVSIVQSLTHQDILIEIEATAAL